MRISSHCQQDLIPIIALCIIEYVKSQKFNVYHIVKDYVIFIYNVIKKYIDIWYFMVFFISYKTIHMILNKNTEEIELKIQDNMWYNRFFISFDNISFYKYTFD